MTVTPVHRKPSRSVAMRSRLFLATRKVKFSSIIANQEMCARVMLPVIRHRRSCTRILKECINLLELCSDDGSQLSINHRMNWCTYESYLIWKIFQFIPFKIYIIIFSYSVMGFGCIGVGKWICVMSRRNMWRNGNGWAACDKVGWVWEAYRYSRYNPRAVGIPEFSQLSQGPPKITRFDTLLHHHHIVENSGSKVSIASLEYISIHAFRIYSSRWR